ncbi:MAG: hypothetical protein ACKV2O_19930 [Acidimicrobiales bacterium]
MTEQPANPDDEGRAGSVVGDGDGDGPVQAEDPDRGDELPEELQPALVTGDYVFPNNSRRRLPAVLYALFALASAALYVNVDSPAVNEGWLAGAVLLGLVALYSWVAGADLAVDERAALVAATIAATFPVGHASAQLGWRGWLCRPTWRLLIYSAEDPPLQRGLIFVDGLDGRVIERIVEPNPEDWTDLVAVRS